jgi:heptosyltransferase-1
MYSIAVIRLSAIGDVVMASPLIHALRERYPEAHIAWLAQPEVRDLLSENGELDEVIVWPRDQWRRLWREGKRWRLLREFIRFVRVLRRRRFDMVIDLQGLLKSGIWARLAGAPVRIGLGSKEGSALLMTEVIPEPDGDKRIGSEYRHLARELGLREAPFEMHIALGEADRAFAHRLAEVEGLKGGYAVLCPFTTRPQKHWFDDYWADLAARLRQEHGLAAVILGGPGDREASERLAETAGAISLAGKTRLREAAAVIAGARLLVGVDTGLTHMGIAFDVPSIVIFGSTCPYRETGRENTRVLYRALDCSPCRRNPTCEGAFTCLRDIHPDEVMENVGELLL